LLHLTEENVKKMSLICKNNVPIEIPHWVWQAASGGREEELGDGAGSVKRRPGHQRREAAASSR
jgi:hypothetical protein